jgi:hypothetical protein
MSSECTYKLVVEQNGKQVVTKVLTYRMVGDITSSLDDNEENNDFFEVAAHHPASSVREYVASKDNISTNVMETLSSDKSIAVLRNLVNTSCFRENATEEQIEKLVKLDIEIAESVANYISSFENADANKLALLLSESNDPSVLATLAGNSDTPKKILKVLSTHSEPEIASQAKNSLDY